MPDFIPRGDADFAMWSERFSTKLSTDGERFGIDPLQAAQYAAAHARYAQALSLCQGGETRSPAEISRKDSARADAVALARTLARLAKAQPTATTTMLLELGLRGQPGGRRPAVSVSPTPPLLRVRWVEGSTARVQLRDGDRPDSRGKGRGVHFAQIFLSAAKTPPQASEDWGPPYHVTSRASFNLPLPAHLPAGTGLWLTAQWVGTTGGTSLACQPVEVRIGAGARRMTPAPLAA